MKRLAGLSLVGLVCAALPLSVASSRPRAGGPAEGPGRAGPGRDMQAMRAIETYWAVLAFELKLDDAKLAELRPMFREAWDARRKAVQKARASRARQGMMKAIRDVNADLEAALKQALSEDEFAKLKAAAARGPIGMATPARGEPAGPADPPPRVGGQGASAEVGQPAPDFALEPIEIHEDFVRWLGDEAPRSFEDVVMLSDFIGKAPIVLLFGSYT